jgi:hypothetical protein
LIKQGFCFCGTLFFYNHKIHGYAILDATGTRHLRCWNTHVLQIGPSNRNKCALWLPNQTLTKKQAHLESRQQVFEQFDGIWLGYGNLLSVNLGNARKGCEHGNYFVLYILDFNPYRWRIHDRELLKKQVR